MSGWSGRCLPDQRSISQTATGCTTPDTGLDDALICRFGERGPSVITLPSTAKGISEWRRTMRVRRGTSRERSVASGSSVAELALDLFDDAEVMAEMLIPARQTTRLWTSCLSIRNDVPGVDQRFPPGSSRNEIRGAGGVSELEDVGLTSGQSVPDASQKKHPKFMTTDINHRCRWTGLHNPEVFSVERSR